MVAWPSLLKLEGDDELIVVGSYHALLDECDALILSQNDCIIDSVGDSYSLRSGRGRDIELVQCKRRFTLENINAMIQAHEFSQAQVCVTKIYFPSIESAISALQ